MMHKKPRYVAVLDIGKTNAKVAIVDTQSMSECAVLKTTNAVQRDGLYPHFDIEALWAFFLTSLATLNRQYPVDAISITIHAASGALVKRDGALALPVLDYEHKGPDDLTDAYNVVRPPFSETYSPRLSMGLNFGAQLFWQSQRFPNEFAQTHHILSLPQYWAMRMTGVSASEATSLGCHTDLWRPATAEFSSMVDKLGWRHLFPPVRSAFDALGPLLPELCKQTGVKQGTLVHSGIHDSNASFLPHLLSRKPPFSVISTGTWVIIFSCGGDLQHLDPSRDTLANSDAFGRPVASGRFMGGREYEVLTKNVEPSDQCHLDTVLEQGILLLPAIENGSGPFIGRDAHWIPAPPAADLIPATASLYLAMMTVTSLALTGSKGDLIVEGPFATNQIFLDMLTVATGQPVFTSASSSTGTSIGAALLALGKETKFTLSARRVTPPAPALAARLAKWRDLWRSHL